MSVQRRTGRPGRPQPPALGSPGPPPERAAPPAPGPTWPSACAPAAHAPPPRSSTRCARCPAAAPRLRSPPGTGPRSYWCCFLRGSRKETGGHLGARPRFPLWKPGAGNRARPEEAAPTRRQTPFPPSRPRLGEAGSRARKGAGERVLHALLGAGASGAQRAEGLGWGW